MTEAQWRTCSNLPVMLEFLRGKVSDRKLRLFACACCRFTFSVLAEDFDRSIEEIIEAMEWYAEGLAGEDLRQDAERQARLIECGPALIDDLVFPALTATASTVVSATDVWTSLVDYVEQLDDEDWRNPGAVKLISFGRQALNDIIGPFPFRCVTLKPSWLAWNDGTIPKLAQGIHDDRAFDRLPLLADALSDAGCDDDDILAHCRQQGKHVWGCWPVDLLLDKK
jgi:hypothetical protein